MSLAWEVWEVLQELNIWGMLAIVAAPLFVVAILDGKDVKIPRIGSLYAELGVALFAAAVAGIITQMGLWVVVTWVVVMVPIVIYEVLSVLRSAYVGRR